MHHHMHGQQIPRLKYLPTLLALKPPRMNRRRHMSPHLLAPMKAHVALVAVEFERRFRHHEVHGGDEVLAQCVLVDEIPFALATA